MSIDADLMHFLKEFGLILFVYSIGLQVGPGFFSSFREGGVRLNQLAIIVVLRGVATTVALYYLTDLDITTMVGVMSGAVTNTPGLGAASAAFKDMNGFDSPNIALGYSVAYPLGVIGCIMAMIFIKSFYKGGKKFGRERNNDVNIQRLSLRVTRNGITGKTLEEIRRENSINFVVSRIMYKDASTCVAADSHTMLNIGDRILVIADSAIHEELTGLIGEPIEHEWIRPEEKLISRKITFTKPKLNGVKLGKLNIRKEFGVNVTRINRAGIDLAPTAGFRLQIGDIVTTVGDEDSINNVKKLHNSR
jgi:putative transport protein